MRIRATARARHAFTAEPLGADLTAVEDEPTPEPVEAVDESEESLTARWDRLARAAEDEETPPVAVQPDLTQFQPISLRASGRRRRNRDALVASALDMVKAALLDDDEGDDGPAQTIEIHNHLPSHNLTVDVAPAQVTPEIRVESPTVSPHFTVEAPAAPDVHVNVEPPAVTVQPAAITVEQPDVTIHPPAVTFQPPDVHVAAPNVTVEVPAPPPRPSAIRVEVDPETGDRVFIPED